MSSSFRLQKFQEEATRRESDIHRYINENRLMVTIFGLKMRKHVAKPINSIRLGKPKFFGWRRKQTVETRGPDEPQPQGQKSGGKRRKQQAEVVFANPLDLENASLSQE